MPAARRPMRRVSARSPTSVVSFHVPLRKGSCVSCRAHHNRHPTLISWLSSTRLRTIHRCVWTYTLGTLGNLLHPSQNLPLLYSHQAATQSPNSHSFPCLPHAELVGVRSSPLHGRCALPPYAHFTLCCSLTYTIPHPRLILSNSPTLPPSPTRRARTSCCSLVLYIPQAPSARCRLLLR
jgi:hypothetical protein